MEQSICWIRLFKLSKVISPFTNAGGSEGSGFTETSSPRKVVNTVILTIGQAFKYASITHNFSQHLTQSFYLRDLVAVFVSRTSNS